MSYKSWPWKSNEHDRTLTSEDLTKFVKGRCTNGVANGLQVKAHSGMTVKLTDGFASIEGKQFYSETDADGEPTTVDCGIASGTYAKYVSIFLRMTISSRTVEPVVKQGVAAATPVRPAKQRDSNVFEIRLADILVPKGVAAITQDMIHDTISDPAECGISINQPQSIDSARFAEELDTWLDLYKTAKTTEFETWFDSVQDALTENAAGNLYTMLQQVPNIVIAETDSSGNPIFPTGDGTYIVIG